MYEYFAFIPEYVARSVIAIIRIAKLLNGPFENLIAHFSYILVYRYMYLYSYFTRRAS